MARHEVGAERDFGKKFWKTAAVVGGVAVAAAIIF
jgi:hypothetical protein